MRVMLLVICLFSTALLAQEVLPFEHESQRQLYQQLTAELRCPQCQNQNIADSNAIVAVDMRQKTYQLVQEGKSRQQVLDYMINRYGDFVHYQPPLNKFTLILWLLPALMVFGLIVLLLFRRKAERNFVTSESSDKTQSQPEQQLEQQLDQLIEQYRRKS